MASELMLANKIGDWKVCKKARTSKKQLVDYCNANFVDDFSKNAECRDPENFCYICCENEYGNMYLKRRDQCYEMCDHLSKKDTANGDWVWHEDILQGKKKSNNNSSSSSILLIVILVIIIVILFSRHNFNFYKIRLNNDNT